MIFKAIWVLVVLALGGCAAAGAGSYPGCTSPSEYQCQIDMYMRSGA